MRRLELNLARRPFTNDTLLLSGLGLLGAVALGMTTWNVVRFVATGSQVAALAERRADLQEQMRQAEGQERALIREIDAARSELLASHAAFASSIIQARSFSWTRLFNELERVMPAGVRLVAVRPRLEDGLRIRLDGIARDNESFWELQERLQEWPVFGNVFPDAVQPTTVRRGLASGEIRISLEMEYFPDARLKLGLPEPDQDSRGEAAEGEAVAAVPEPLQEDGPAPAQEPAPAGGGSPPEQAAADDAPAARSVAPATREKKRAPPPRPRVGVERLNPLPQGAPGLEVPDIKTIRRPELQRGLDVPAVQIIDGQAVDENGNVIPIEDLINIPGGIRVGPSPDLGGDTPPGRDGEAGTRPAGAGGGEPPPDKDPDGAGGNRGRGERP